jgi:uncharacterized protein YukE
MRILNRRIGLALLAGLTLAAPLAYAEEDSRSMAEHILSIEEATDLMPPMPASCVNAVNLVAEKLYQATEPAEKKTLKALLARAQSCAAKSARIANDGKALSNTGSGLSDAMAQTAGGPEGSKMAADYHRVQRAIDQWVKRVPSYLERVRAQVKAAQKVVADVDDGLNALYGTPCSMVGACPRGQECVERKDANGNVTGNECKPFTQAPKAPARGSSAPARRATSPESTH